MQVKLSGTGIAQLLQCLIVYRYRDVKRNVKSHPNLSKALIAATVKVDDGK